MKEQMVQKEQNNRSKFSDPKFVALIATLCCLLWGSAYPSIKLGYLAFDIMPEDIASKYVFAGYRFVLAGLVLLVLFRATGKKVLALSKSQMTSLLVLGLMQTGLQYIFFYVGVGNTTGVKGSIMNATTTFFSVIFAHYLYKNDKLGKNKIIGCLLGFIGVIFVNFHTDLLAFSFSYKGEGFVILAALIFSITAIYAKKLTATIDVLLVTGFSLLIGGLALTLLGLGLGGRVTHFTPESAGNLIYLALLSSAAFCLWNLLLKYNKVGQVSVYNFLIPVFGTLLSALFLGEQIMEFKNLVALLFVSLGIYMVNRTRKEVIVPQGSEALRSSR
ncbi:Permease of the drug/metabolite transporter (DMT) superfamily [Paenibacillus algorifonticola]|uniref:Permease of the drug/metabolite transporter (DMT) superfamily n=1 Tax=Paenibacillus algorifonticola TaxID=684063 RepID=A0A1I2GXY4_9BACL|nr:DMT family transporter [Paenibacillus algorifonticola]SFF21421.1 Permease of the drug/metabolite transporter (DMT) superfamily [Paenibacillus algorifonticola]